MSTAKHPRITLELETGADPIRGLIEHPDGSREPFWGWLELIEQLRRAAAEPPPPLEPTTARTGSGPERDAQAKRQRPHTTTQEQP
jgi:hypothetical protein